MIRIDAALCDGCGTCGRICPRDVMVTTTTDGKKVTRVTEERRDICLDCGQCAAVCPKDAIRVDGLDPAQFVPLEPLGLEPDALLRLFAQRRSVRRYKDKPVGRDVLERIAAAAHRAPPAAGRAEVGLLVLDKPERLREMMQHVYRMYAELGGVLRNPIGRWIVGRRAGKRARHTLQTFIMPAMRWYQEWYRTGRSDEIRRDAPVVMLFHARTLAPAGDESCLLAAFQAALMAEALGVGACVNGMLPPAYSRDAALRALIGLPADHDVYASLGLGWPKYPYRKAIVRRLTEVRYLE